MRPTAKEDSSWGRVTRYEAGFEKGGALSSSEIVSGASLYRSAHGAHLSTLDSVRRGSKPITGGTITPLSTGGRIGQETYFYKITRKQEALTVVLYFVLWRENNVKASLLVAGLGLTDPALAIR